MGNIDINRIDHVRKYRLGTRYCGPLGERCIYVKVDFGIVGKTEGKTLRNIQYMWFPQNNLAAHSLKTKRPDMLMMRVG